MEWGIRFIAVVDHVDTNDTANKKSRQINGLINEWYLEDLSTNVRSVLDHKRKEGLFIGSFALYGYCKDPEAKGKLVVDPEAAEIVKRIFSMALSGIGAHKIARILNDEKVPSPTAYKQMNGIHYHIAAKNRNVGLWSSPTVYQMLHNQTYAGNLVQGRHKKISYKAEKTMWLPKSQWIVVENTHEPIIDMETFETVQMMLKERTRAGQRARYIHLQKNRLRMLWKLYGADGTPAESGWNTKTLCPLPDAPARTGSVRQQELYRYGRVGECCTGTYPGVCGRLF